MPTVVVACDKFKGSLTAPDVVRALGRGLRQVAPDLRVVQAPVADGGEGTLDAALAAGYDEVRTTATGPTGEPIRTRYARRDSHAVVELAEISGLGRLDGRLCPLTSTTRGTGEVIAAAIDAGCRSITIGIGGSSSTDGGAGLLRALGAWVTDAHGHEVPDGGGSLIDIHAVELARLEDRIRNVTFEVACDVDNPLTGPTGAAAVFAPQKGASAAEVRLLDEGLAHWAATVSTAIEDATLATPDQPGAGAAGGVGFAALAVLGATFRPGVSVVLDLIRFDDHLVNADLVVTGEGSLDRQTLSGKTPMGVALAARRGGVEVVGVCGVNQLGAEDLTALGLTAVYPLSDWEPDPVRSMARAAALLETVGRRIAREHPAAPSRSY